MAFPCCASFSTALTGSAIAAEFGATPGRIQQTLAVFLAGLAIGQGLYGPLLDRYGRVVRLRSEEAAAKALEGTQPLMSEDIAETAYWIATLPPHVNINYIEMMPTCQGFGPLAIKRKLPA